MVLFLHLRVLDDPINFGDQIVLPQKGSREHVTFFDLDNFSDEITVSTAIRGMKEAQALFVYLEMASENNVQSIAKILGQLIRFDKPLRLSYHGSHPMLDNIINRLGDKAHKTSDIQQELNLFLARV